jgi:hypothetical protein
MSIRKLHRVPMNSIFDRFFNWADEFAANASNKVFEPIIDTAVGAHVNIVGGAGKGIGTYLGNENNIKDLVNVGIASQTGGLVGLGTNKGTGTGTGNETGTETNTTDTTKTIKYILGGLVIVGLGYLLIKD